MDSVGMDLQLCEKTSEYQESRSVVEETQQQEARSSSSEPPSGSTDGPSTSLNTYQTSSDLATGTTVPVGDERGSKRSTSSTSSSTSSNESRSAGASLYIPEYLTPSISYDRQSENQLLIALIGRAFDQPVKLASLLQQQVTKPPNIETPVAKFTPFTVKRKALCRGNFDNAELKKHDLICLCYNASEARILLTGQDGYYTALLKQIEHFMGPNKVAFLISNYSPPHYRSSHVDPHTNRPQSTTDTRELIAPALRARLSLQPALTHYLEQGQVLAWVDEPLSSHTERLVEIARLEPNPQSILNLCSVM